MTLELWLGAAVTATMALVAGLFFAHVSGRRRVMAELEEEIRLRHAAEARSALLIRAVEQSASAVIITDRNGFIEYVNDKFVTMTGYPREEVLGKTASILKPEDEPDGNFAALRQALAAGSEWHGEFRNRRRGGEIFWVQSSISPIKDRIGRITNYLAVQDDVTEAKLYEQALEQKINIDGLTGLPNRVLARDRLAHALADAPRRGRRVAVLFVDLDGFKYVNDTLGHAAGDAVLVTVADRLKSVLRPGDTVARLGGDEFLVILVGLDESASIEALVDRLNRRLRQPMFHEDNKILPLASIGVAVHPGDGDSAELLIERADAAMYAAKSRGDHGVAFAGETR